MHLVRLALTSALPLVLAVGLSACGDDDPARSPAASSGAPAGAGSCPDVQVPGHQAVMLRAQGTGCATARAVAAAAEGRGRAPYEQAGFACEGTDAAGGDTDYTCTMGDARITFLYGTT